MVFSPAIRKKNRPASRFFFRAVGRFCRKVCYLILQGEDEFIIGDPLFLEYTH